MGFSFCPEHTSKGILIDSILRDYRSGGNTVIDYKSVKDGLWVLVTPKGSDAPIICFDLIEKAGGCYGNKAMDESEHPYYYDCPLSYLEKAPMLSQEWRNGVKKYYERKEEIKNIKIVKGNYIVNGNWKIQGMPLKEVYVSDEKPLRGWFNGSTFKIPSKMKKDMVKKDS